MKTYWLGLICLGLVCLRFSSIFKAEKTQQDLVGKEILMRGKISSEPILQGNSQTFRLGRIEIRIKAYPRFHYGDKLQLIGTLEERVINHWYSRFGLVYPSVELIKSDSSISSVLDWRKQIYKLREKIEAVYNQVLPEPEASLLAGIVLGSKRGLPRDFWQALQTTSTLHIVVASGYNVTVVIGTVISYLAGWVKRRTAVMIGILAVFAYTVMAGAEAAIVRAAIMGSLAYFGQILGKKGDGIRMLVTAGLVMILYNPLLIWDVGFQLSMAATAGLILISPLIDKLVGKIWLVGKDVSETLAAQIAVWPILLITFSQLSAFGILVNSLILWLVPIIMVLGAVLAGLGLVWLPLGQLVGWVTYGPLRLMVSIIKWFGSFSWMSWQIEGVGWWWGWGYYFVLAVGLRHFYKQKRNE